MKTMKSNLFLSFLLLFTFINLIAARKPHVINFRSANLYPESFTWDPRSQHFIVSSTRHHKLLSVSDAGVVDTLISDDTLPANSSFLGLALDRQHHRLLAVLHRPFNALAAYDLPTRSRVFLAELPRAAVANDVAVDHSGNAYVTDSGADVIYKVTPDGHVSTLSQSKAFKSHPVDPTITSGLNGVVYSSNGYLLVAQSNTGKLFKVNVDDGSARTVTLNKDLTAADGVAVRKDGVVLVVSQHKLYFVKSNDAWGGGGVFDETALESEKFATAVTVGDEKRVYVLYGHVDEGIKGNGDRDLFSIVEVESEVENKEDNIWLYVLVGLGFAYFFFWRFQMRSLVENMNKKTS